MQAFITSEQFDHLVVELQKKLPKFERLGNTFMFESQGEVGSLWFTETSEKDIKVVIFGKRVLECFNAVVKYRYVPRDSKEFEFDTPAIPLETKKVYPQEIPNTERME